MLDWQTVEQFFDLQWGLGDAVDLLPLGQVFPGVDSQKDPAQIVDGVTTGSSQDGEPVRRATEALQLQAEGEASHLDSLDLGPSEWGVGQIETILVLVRWS